MLQTNQQLKTNERSRMQTGFGDRSTEPVTFLMSTWIGLIGLYFIHEIVAVFTVAQAICNRWSSPLQSASSTHITPPPPKCIAIVLIDPVITKQEAKQLALVLNWQVKMLEDPWLAAASIGMQTVKCAAGATRNNCKKSCCMILEGWMRL